MDIKRLAVSQAYAIRQSNVRNGFSIYALLLEFRQERFCNL